MKLNQIWLDLGAGDGTYLRWMSQDSYGLDIKGDADRKIQSWNFNSEVPDILQSSTDVVWCSNLIEHVLRPHEFLLEIKRFLRKDGIVILVCPQTLIRNPLIYRGTLQGDHVNFFNLTTLKLTVKAAGFEVLYSGTPSFAKFGMRLAFVAPTIFVVIKPIQDFQYPQSAHKYLDADGKICFKEENLGH